MISPDCPRFFPFLRVSEASSPRRRCVQVIKGWDEALMKMSLGEKALIMIPAAKAYGDQGTGHGTVPPDADLKFQIELLKIQRQTSCLGAGRHGGVQKDSHEYQQLANQLLGRA